MDQVVGWGVPWGSPGAPWAAAVAPWGSPGLPGALGLRWGYNLLAVSLHVSPSVQMEIAHSGRSHIVSVIIVWACVLCLGVDLGLSLDLDLDLGCAPEGVGSS